MIRYFALVVDNDVFYTLAMDEDHPVGNKWSAALQSNVKFIKMNSFSQVKPGFFYKDGNFYDREDSEMLTPLTENILENLDENKYAGVLDNDVIGIMTTVKSEFPEGMFEMVDAGMQSNPTIIEYTDHPQKISIGPGWIWDGFTFKRVGA